MQVSSKYPPGSKHPNRPGPRAQGPGPVLSLHSAPPCDGPDRGDAGTHAEPSSGTIWPCFSLETTEICNRKMRFDPNNPSQSANDQLATEALGQEEKPSGVRPYGVAQIQGRRKLAVPWPNVDKMLPSTARKGLYDRRKLSRNQWSDTM